MDARMAEIETKMAELTDKQATTEAALQALIAHDSNRRGELGQNAFGIGQALLVIHAVGSFRP